MDSIVLEKMSAEDRILTALSKKGTQPMLSTSFGIQSALLLHMVSKIAPKIPVIFIDTGFLFPETLSFGEMLKERLSLNLKIYRPLLSKEEILSQHGELWNQGKKGIEKYNQLVKVEPMSRALAEVRTSIWFSGLRKSQSQERSRRRVLDKLENFWKIYPILDWSDRDVFQYLKKHELPYHPLWEKGYLSVGDIHSSSPLGAGMEEEKTRFGGIKRECGIHEIQ